MLYNRKNKGLNSKQYKFCMVLRGCKRARDKDFIIRLDNKMINRLGISRAIALSNMYKLNIGQYSKFVNFNVSYTKASLKYLCKYIRCFEDRDF